MPESLQRTYASTPFVPGAARQEIFEFLSNRASEEATSAALLVVTELVTNAVVHAGGAIELRTTLDGERLRIEVVDSSSAPPRLRDPGDGGRGLRIVDELATDWGVVRDDGAGKTTWCEISTA